MVRSLSETDKAIEIWENASKILKELVGEKTFMAWFSDLKTLGLMNDTLYLGAPNEFYIEWVEHHYLDKVKKAVSLVTDGKISVSFSLNESEEIMQEEKEEKQKSGDKFKKFRLIKTLTFNNFVVGPSNEFAYKSAFEVAKNPVKKFNPLYIYGPSGVGKTHLLHAMGNYILVNSKTDYKILYITAEEFLTKMINAIKNKSMVRFKSQIRDIDVLLIDEIQFLNSKPMIQEEIFHTIDSLMRSNKQVVLASDRSPEKIDSLDERIRTRMRSGLVAEIKPVDFELRKKFILERIKSENILLKDEYVDYIAYKPIKSIRDLEGIINAIKAKQEFDGREITKHFLVDLLKTFNHDKNPVELVELMKVVSDVFNVPKELIAGKTRKAQVMRARHAFVYVARVRLNVPYKKLGRALGGRDHSTIIHSYEQGKFLFYTDSKFKENIDSVIDLLFGEK